MMKKVSVYSDVETFVRNSIKIEYVEKTKKHINLVCSFDIETTSFYDENDEKSALMYCWQFAINESVYIGRTFEEFTELLTLLHEYTDCSEEKTLIVYVHNLSYEFQFIRKYLDWSKVFAMEKRKVLYAVTTQGIEFRCSYLLTNMSLNKVAEHCTDKPIKKLSDEFDYEKVRTPLTPLTDTEIAYCKNDVLIITRYINQELKQNDLTLDSIPLTATGYVRKYCRHSIRFADGCTARDKKSQKQYKQYRDLMSALTVDPEEYKLLKMAFQGGFTHANAYHVNEVLNNVDSIDFTSSYPSVMIAEQFPMSKGIKVKISSREEFDNYINSYCCVFICKLDGVTSSFKYENYITSSKCYNLVNPVVNNGRIVSADSLMIAITNVDYKIIKQVYDIEHMQVFDFYIYKRGYLPTPLVRSILKLYENKTKLKGVAGAEVEYQNSKGMINSTYGMTVTDISKDVINYINDTWEIEEGNNDENIERYNTSKKRFLFYPWGIFVTAYARRNLWTGILEFKDDYLYSDTDSIKCINFDNHKKYINSYNDYTIYKLKKACDFHGLSHEMIAPKTIKGISKPLGVWDLETSDSKYSRFKTLGAKRYIYEYKNKIYVTIAGVSKHYGAEFLEQFKDPFKQFDNDLYFPPEYSGKLTHTYIDDERSGTLFDYKGVPYEYRIKSCVHLEKSDYHLEMGYFFTEYIKKLYGG